MPFGTDASQYSAVFADIMYILFNLVLQSST